MHRYCLLALLIGCSPATYYLAPADTAPSGRAPRASHRLVASHADGTREYALILRDGDELASAVLAFAKNERVVAARFSALGAVRDAHVAFFDLTRKQYRVSELREQLELISLIGDVGIDDESKAPVVHAHVVLSRDDAQTSGGHLIRASASPNAEVFITTYPDPLIKRMQPQYDAKFFDLAPTP